MQVKTMAVIRDGQIKMRLPGCTVRADGTIWSSGNKNPLVDGQAPKSIEIGTAKLQAMLKAGQAEQIPVECLAQLGENESGLLVMDSAEYTAQERAAAEAAMTPAQRDKIEIEKLYAQAERLENSDSEDNVSGPIRLRAQARKLQAKWEAKYAPEASKAKAESLREQARRERETAVGALTYDADGWLSAEDQQRRHDEHMTRAAQVEAQAAELEGK